jgi:predicted flap endonuclease-1-like 5' DNA nuclease
VDPSTDHILGEPDAEITLVEFGSYACPFCRAANERIAELERHAPPIGTDTAAAVGAAARGGRDDLSLIRGVDRGGETRLNDLHIYRYRDLTRLSAEDEAALEGRMGLEPGTIAREEWREQAALLERDERDQHRARYR